MHFMLIPPLKYAHRWRGKKAKQYPVQINSAYMLRTEKHKYMTILAHNLRYTV